MSEQSEAALRERIDETRARMGHTIEQIGDRVNPSRVKADLKARAREQVHEIKDNAKRKARNSMRNVSDAGRGIWSAIRENPIPAGMIGVGLAWLLKNRRAADEYRYDAERFDAFSAREPYRSGYMEPSYDNSYERDVSRDLEYGRTTFAEGPVGFGSADTHWRGDGDRGLREKASERVSDVKHRVGEVAHQAQDRIGDLAHRASDRVREMPHSVEHRMQENPVAAGAMALAIGMAAGMMIPESEREHRMFGQRRDQLLDRAQDAARRAGEKLHTAARDAAGESARSMVDDVWPGGEERTGDEGFSEPRR